MSAVGLNLPVTSTFALPLSVYHIYLQARVIQQRVRTKQSIGQQSTPSTADPKSADPLATPSASPDLLQAACRAQGNFTENVPLALILAALAELNGGNKTVLSTALGMLLVARVMHADFGLLNTKKNSTGFGRPIGFLTTAGVIAGLAGYSAWLTRGYWES